MAESWACTSLGVEEQLLIFLSCLSPDESKSFKTSSQTPLSKLAKVLIWNIQSPHEDNLSSCERCKIITSKALGTMRAQHFLIAERERSIYDSCRFDIGRLRSEPTNYERCLHPSDTFAYHSACNNLFLTLSVIHKLKSNKSINVSVYQL